MGDINREAIYRSTGERQNSENGDAAAAYRQLLGQVECPQEVRHAALRGCIERQGTGKKTTLLRRWRYTAIVVGSLVVLCLLGGVLFGEQISYALGIRGHRQGYIYEEKEYEGLEFTKTFVMFSKWNQNIAMGMQPREGQYEGVYEDLRQLGLLKVLLPQYRVEFYKQEQKEICSEPNYKALYCTYRDGDSQIGMNIRYATETSAQSTVSMPDSYDKISVNGIEYDVQHFSRKADYEEYLLMQQYNSKGDGDEPILSREEYEDIFFYPVQIECMVNSVYYCFQLTEDIDVQEFLDSIHFQPSAQAPRPLMEPLDIGEEEVCPTGGSETAYKYTKVEYEGLELTSCYMERYYADQQLVVQAQQPENQYAGIYEELRELGLLSDVLLPHYQVERYTLSGSGSQKLQFEQDWYGVYEDGDSRISIILRKLGQGMATQSTDMLSGHESRTVNGVDYEILYHARPITYEEYLLMQQYRVKYSYEAWSCSRIEYEESYFYYPVEILCVVNGIEYSFKISEDIDIEEFLESIY